MNFGCTITDADIVRAWGPEQPEEVKVGQTWMRCSDGATMAVKRVRTDAPNHDGILVDLGGDSYTVIVGSRTLREEWVCVDLPELTPVTELRRD